MEVTALDCTSKITVKTIFDKTLLKVMPTDPQYQEVQQQIDINTNTYASRCIMTYSLVDTSNNPYTGTNVKVDSTTGVVSIDQ